MKDFLKRIKLNESNIGFGMGVVVMVLAGVLLVNYFKNVNRVSSDQKTLSTSTEKAAEAASSVVQPEATETSTPTNKGEYVVKKGDSLWNIAAVNLGSGFEWKLIYDQNKGTIGSNPGNLEIGTKIILPKIEVVTKDYVVKKGDNLWNISVQLCGSGWSFQSIATDNKLANPRLIYPETKLKVTCRVKQN